MECVALLVGNGEFHDGGSTHAYSFREYPTVLICLGVGRSQYAGCVVPCRFPPRPTRSLRSLLEVGGSTSKMLKSPTLRIPPRSRGGGCQPSGIVPRNCWNRAVGRTGVLPTARSGVSSRFVNTHRLSSRCGRLRALVAAQTEFDHKTDGIVRNVRLLCAAVLFEVDDVVLSQ